MMNADTPSMASEAMWKATRSRLCRITCGSVVPSRCQTVRGRTALRADEERQDRISVSSRWRSPRRTRVRGRIVDQLASDAGDDRLQGPASVSSATTGRPDAWASSGTIPKSSLAGQQHDRSSPAHRAHVFVRESAEEFHLSSSGTLECRALGSVAHDFQGDPRFGARLDSHLDPLIWHERRDNQREWFGSRPIGSEECGVDRGYTTMASRL